MEDIFVVGTYVGVGY